MGPLIARLYVLEWGLKCCQARVLIFRTVGVVYKSQETQLRLMLVFPPVPAPFIHISHTHADPPTAVWPLPRQPTDSLDASIRTRCSSCVTSAQPPRSASTTRRSELNSFPEVSRSFVDIFGWLIDVHMLFLAPRSHSRRGSDRKESLHISGLCHLSSSRDFTQAGALLKKKRRKKKSKTNKRLRPCSFVSKLDWYEPHGSAQLRHFMFMWSGKHIGIYGPANKPTCSGFPDNKATEAPPPVPPATLMTVLNVCRFVFSIRTWTEAVMEQRGMQMGCCTAVWALFHSALSNHIKAVPAELLMTCLACTQISMTTLPRSHRKARPSDWTTVTCCLMLSMLSLFSCRSVVVLFYSVSREDFGVFFCFILFFQVKLNDTIWKKIALCHYN